MPEIEELPDDPGPAVASEAKTGIASSGSRASSARAAASGSDGSMQRGFLNKPKRKPADVSAAAKEDSVQLPTTTNTVTHADEPAPTLSSDAVRNDDSAERSGREAFQETEHCFKPEELLGSFRARLQGVVDQSRATSRANAGREVDAAAEELKDLLETFLGQAKWPTPQAKDLCDRATADINTSLAEMRAASNDARRLRSGEDRRAMSEFQHAADDVVDRVRKVAESLSPKDASIEARAEFSIAAFHTLPLAAKLRILADERIGKALLAGSFLVGMGFMLALLAEFYTAWNCGIRCTL